jgi:Protein of unknown function (DUF3117)
MGAMKPRAGSGPIEAEKERGKVVIRVPMDDGERLVVSLDAQEAEELGRLLAGSGSAE